MPLDKPISTLRGGKNITFSDIHRTQLATIDDLLSHRLGWPRYDVLWLAMAVPVQELTKWATEDVPSGNGLKKVNFDVVQQKLWNQVLLMYMDAIKYFYGDKKITQGVHLTHSGPPLEN